MICSAHSCHAILLVLQIENEVFNAICQLMPIFNWLNVHRPNDFDSVALQPFHEVASNKSACSANDCAWRLNIALEHPTLHAAPPSNRDQRGGFWYRARHFA